MSQVSRPMQIALAAVVLLAAMWFVALRPKPTSEAEQAAAPAQTTPAAPAQTTPAATTPAPTTAVRGDAKPASPRATPQQTARQARASGPVGEVRFALRHHKAVAIAFIDPRTADARAVAREIGHVSTFGGRAVRLAVPLSKLSAYPFITNEVEVTVAPTVVIVDRQRHATTIVGFADRGEIEQRLADALASKK